MRRGYALLTVLWATTALSALGLALAVTTREALLATGNRTALVQARWEALGCLEQLRDGVIRVRGSSPTGDPTEALRIAAVEVESRRQGRGCTTQVSVLGSGLDVNNADAWSLRQLFQAEGLTRGAADSLAAAILDWVDEDSIPRDGGAEADWYALRDRALPANRPVRDRRELAFVRGLERASPVSSVIGVEAGPVVLSTVPASVLSVVGASTAPEVADLQDARRSGDLRDRDVRSARVLGTRTDLDVTLEPTQWLVTASAGGRGGRVNLTVEWLVELAGTEPLVRRQRVWVQ